jgi:hypothetical protein
MMIKKAEKITDADDLKNAKEQRQAMANFRPRDHRAPARRQSGFIVGLSTPVQSICWNAAYGLHKTQSFAKKPGEGGALLSVSWSRPCLEMVVNFEIRALRYADL